MAYSAFATVAPSFLVGLLLGMLAWTLWGAKRREAGIGALSLFLALLALSFLLGAIADWMPGRPSDGGDTPLRWALRVGSFAVNIADVVPLSYFVGEYPQRNRLASRRVRLGALGVALGLELLLFAMPEAMIQGRGALYYVNETLSNATIAFALFPFLLRELRRPAGSSETLPPGFLAAWCVVFYLRIPFAYTLLFMPHAGFEGAGISWGAWELLQAGLDLALTFGALAASYAILRPFVDSKRRPELQRILRHTGLVALGIIGFVRSVGVLQLLFDQGRLPASGSLIQLTMLASSNSRYAIRWIYFLSAIGPALLANRVVEMEAYRRRRLVAAVTTSALVILLLAVTALAGSQVDVDTIPPYRLLLIGGFFVLAIMMTTQAGRRVAERLFPKREEREESLRHLRKFEAYRGAAEAVAAGRGNPADLERLRLALHLSSEEARLAAAARNAPCSRPLEAGVIVGRRYRIERALGRGAHGRVFLAHDERDNRPIALKELALDAHGGLDQELLAASRLYHPSIVPILDCFAQDGSAFVAMEYVPGGSLADCLARARTLPPDEAARFTQDILDALEAAHAAGIIHRDVKPANILLDASGRARLSDFGVSLAQEADRTVTSGFDRNFAGTLAYLPPEALVGAAPRASWDLYALGTILFEATEGHTPSRSEPPSTTNPFAPIIRRARCEDPEARFASARDMRVAMETLIAPLPQRHPTIS